MNPKVLHIIDSGGLYGAEKVLLNLMAEQARQGLEPVMASIGELGIVEKDVETEALKRGLRVEKFRMRPGSNWLGAFAVLRFARRMKADILHSHGYKGNILFGLIPRRFRRLPIVATLHGWTWTGRLNRMLLYEWLDAVSLRFIDHVVLVNGMMENHHRLKELPDDRKSIINNGTDFASDKGPDSASLPTELRDFVERGFTVVGVGRFSPEKGFSSLIGAVADLIKEGLDLQLLLLGDGGLRGELEGQIKEWGVSDRVLMPGYVDNIHLFLKKCRIFAMPSLTEGLPMALLEAMGAGIPIVASRVGGIPDALGGGEAGVLIEPGDSDALKDALRCIFQAPEKMKECVALARERVEREYSSRKMAESYLKVYRQVLGQGRVD